MTKAKKLQRGARVTFLRDGSEIFSACEIPAEGAFTVRSLPAGQWLCRDSTGGELAFTVKVHNEVVTLIAGDTVGVTGEPGVSGVVDVRPHHVGQNSVFTDPDQVAAGESVTSPVRLAVGETPHEVVAAPPAPDHPFQRPKDLGSEERVPGGAGSAHVEDGEPVPLKVKPDPVGPEPLESTDISHQGGGITKSPTPTFG